MGSIKINWEKNRKEGLYWVWFTKGAEATRSMTTFNRVRVKLASRCHTIKQRAVMCNHFWKLKKKEIWLLATCSQLFKNWTLLILKIVMKIWLLDAIDRCCWEIAFNYNHLIFIDYIIKICSESCRNVDKNAMHFVVTKLLRFLHFIKLSILKFKSLEASGFPQIFISVWISCPD